VPVFAEPKTLSPKDDLASVPLEENKIPPIAPEPPREKTAAPITPPPPISPSPVQAPDVFEKERTDISQILKEVKLPERRPPVSSALAGGAVPQAHVFDTALGAAADKKPPDTVQAAPVPETPSIANTISSSIVAPLRTLKNDLQEIVRVKKISLVRAAALEQEKKYGRGDVHEASAPSGHSRRGSGMLFAAALFLVLGGAAVFGVYVIMQERMGIAPTVSSTASLLFAETTVSFSLDNLSSLDLKRKLAQTRAGLNATLGSVTHIVPVVSAEASVQADQGSGTRPATLQEFLAALGTRASPDLVRALGSDFFFGIHTVDKNAPVLVIPVVSYEHAFAGMLAWERTMNADLAPVFTAVPDQVAGPGGLPQKRQFNDLVMRNYDVRALKDDAGVIELYYSFPTKELLIIAESPYSFAEVLSRLRAGGKL